MRLKLPNLDRFILDQMTELQVSEKSRLSIQICLVAVFVKVGNAECV